MTLPAPSLELSLLRELEAESVHIMREVAAEFERPVLLFSGGKDSIVLLRLAEKAFRPAAFPFPVMHIDTGHNFPEVIDFRDRRVRELDEQLIVASVQESIDKGRAVEEGALAQPAADGDAARRDRRAQASTPRSAARGATRSARGRRSAIFSFRDDHGQWDPRAQRPELWNLYNGDVAPGEHVRVFPISNWTELDVWRYIREEELELPSIYYAHEREVFERDGMLYAVSEHLTGDEPTFVERVRYRTVGDMTITGAVRSDATDVDAVIEETAATRLTERGATRADDRTSEAAMEDRKREGYF